MEIAVGIMFLLAGGIVGAAIAVLRWWTFRRRVHSRVKAAIEEAIRRKTANGKVIPRNSGICGNG